MSKSGLSQDAGNLPSDREARIEERLRQARDSRARARIPRRPAPAAPLPASLSQEGIWFLEQLHPGSGLWNLARILWWRGQLDRPALLCSLGLLVERHEALRTRLFSREGRPVQVVS